MYFVNYKAELALSIYDSIDYMITVYHMKVQKCSHVRCNVVVKC